MNQQPRYANKRNRLMTSLVLALSIGLGSCEQDEQSATQLHIIGGTAVDLNDPIARSTVRVGECSGALIAPQTVITASHCLRDGGQIDVWFETPGGPLLTLGQAIRHPNFDQTSYPFPGDVALVFLNQPAPATNKPVTLAKPDHHLPVGTPVTLAGYGIQNEAFMFADDTLHKVMVEVIGFDDNLKLITFQQPAGTTGIKSACYGDSGGPMYLGDGSTTTLYGVTHGALPVTEGDTVCKGGGFYTDIRPYYDWIMATMAHPNLPPLDDHSDTPYNATPLTAGVAAKGLLEMNDTDNFVIELEEESEISLRVEGCGALSLNAIDTPLEPLGYGFANQPEILANLPAGTYIVGISLYWEAKFCSTLEYKLHYSITPKAPVFKLADYVTDDFEVVAATEGDVVRLKPNFCKTGTNPQKAATLTIDVSDAVSADGDYDLMIYTPLSAFDELGIAVTGSYNELRDGQQTAFAVVAMPFHQPRVMATRRILKEQPFVKIYLRCGYSQNAYLDKLRILSHAR